MNIDQILKVEIVPTLTDFVNDQIVFWDTFEKNKEQGFPIKNILELGVYRLLDDKNSLYPGQSTKTLMTLAHFYKDVEKFISLDIDNCISTIENCKRWVEERGVEVKNHKFVQSNSVHFDVKSEFPNGIDFIFLDTNHDDTYPEKLGYENSGGPGMTYKEICYYAHHLTSNEHLFLHDTFNYYVPEADGVNTSGAVKKFIAENPEFDFIEHKPNAHGLGEIFRKKI